MGKRTYDPNETVVDTITGDVVKVSDYKGIWFSASLIKDAQSCMAKAYGRITKQPQINPGIALINGSAAHAGMEGWLKERKDPIKGYNDYFKSECEKQNFDWKSSEAEDKRLEGEKMVACTWEQFKSESFLAKVDPNLVEAGFKVMRAGRIFVGYLDLLYFKEPGKYNYVDFKGLSLDTPIPTPAGWSTMGGLKEGDELFDESGSVCRVTAKSSVHHKKCYRVTFDDRTSIVCDYDHRWKTTYISGNYEATRVLETDDLKDRVDRNQRHVIPNAGALELPDAELPIHPYLLGAWLGDGKSRDGSITIASEEKAIVSRIQDCGYEVGPAFDITDSCFQITVYDIRGKLSELGLLNNKHVPDTYLRGSYGQRLSLLQGLMDTDGFYHPKRRRAVFTNCSRQLAESVAELVASLGSKASTFKVKRNGFGKEVDCYDVTFAPVEFNPFSLARKADLVITPTTNRSRRRTVVSIEEVDTVDTQCIMVDSPTHTYLCGKQMVVTHNTGKYAPKINPITGGSWELDSDLQFNIYPWATYHDPKLPTYEIWPEYGVWFHMRGKNVGREEVKHRDGTVGWQTAKKDANKVWKFDFPTKPTPESVEKLFIDTIDPVCNDLEDGRWKRNRTDLCEYCGFFDRVKEKCMVDLPIDGLAERSASQLTLLEPKGKAA